MVDIDALERELAATIGEGALSRDPGTCALFSQDIFYQTDPVALIVRPATTAAVAAAVRIAAMHGARIVTRGGGMSYSGGYMAPDPASSILLDMRAMNDILMVDCDDMYVVVEPGCTWEKLHTRLDPMGLRTPYWGTLSGRQATIGGGISQNAIFWGSGRAGSAADSVIGLEIVTGQGDIVRTGSLGVAGASPFFRHFGPDLTGLFTADAGAHGIKTAIILRLERKPDVSDGLSFLLPDPAALCGLLAEAARTGLVAQQMGLDDGLKAARMAGGSLWEDLRTAWQVMRHGGSRLRGLGRAARMALAGRKLLDALPYSAHLFVEGASPAQLNIAKQRLRAVAATFGAREVPASVPRAMLAAPFPTLGGITGPAGERWVPVHCVMPSSRAIAAYEAIAAIFADRRTDMARYGITTAWLFTTIGNHALVIEPMFFWPDALGDLHRETLGEKRLARLTPRPPCPEARALVDAIRKAIVAAVEPLGALHIQIGGFYPYAGRLDAPTRALAEAVRHHVDPRGTINPQSLPGRTGAA